MKIRHIVLLFVLLFSQVVFSAQSVSTETVSIALQTQYDSVKPGTTSAIAINFKCVGDWHYYATTRNLDTPDSKISIKASSDSDIKLYAPVFPEYTELDFYGAMLDVYGGNFTVYIPFETAKDSQTLDTKIDVVISGQMCTDQLCSAPDTQTLDIAIKLSPDAAMDAPAFVMPEFEKETTEASTEETSSDDRWTKMSTTAALLIALLAGLTLNIMPCVLPVIPLKVLSLVEHAHKDRAKSAALGLAFCIGILLFFAILAGVNVSIKIAGDGQFSWGSHFQHPPVIISMSLVLVLLGLFMLGVFEIILPSWIAGKSGSGGGVTGSLAMGFFAGILSTPCSFGLLTGALIWAQTQNMFLGTFTIMLIGFGMAMPYLVLTIWPSLLKFLPKAGKWSEIFKQMTGFIMFVIAIFLLRALPKEWFTNILYFCVILSFCVWMWAGWVTMVTPKKRKYIIRFIALVIVIPAGMWLLPRPVTAVQWRDYNRFEILSEVDSGKPVLIDFTADWCMNCLAVDKFIYGSKKVIKLISEKGVITYKADNSLADYPASIDRKNIYMEPGVPVTIFYIPGEKEPVKFRGVSFSDAIIELLENLPDVAEQKQVTDPNG